MALHLGQQVHRLLSDRLFGDFRLDHRYLARCKGLPDPNVLQALAQRGGGRQAPGGVGGVERIEAPAPQHPLSRQQGLQTGQHFDVTAGGFEARTGRAQAGLGDIELFTAGGRLGRLQFLERARGGLVFAGSPLNGRHRLHAFPFQLAAARLLDAADLFHVLRAETDLTRYGCEFAAE